MAVIQELQGILTGLGFEPELLLPDHRLRAELALSSAETTELGLELERRFGAQIDLWDSHDYTLAELAEAVDAAKAGHAGPTEHPGHAVDNATSAATPDGGER